MTTYTCYRWRKDLDAEEVCNFGCKHKVTYHESVEITEAPDEFYQEWIKALHYTHDGEGTVQVGYDQYGQRYTREPYWDGYAYWTLDGDSSIKYSSRISRRGDVTRLTDGTQIYPKVKD